MKKLMSFILAAVLLLGLAIPAMAADEFEILNNVLIRYRGEGGDIVIPDGVTEIFDDAFYIDSFNFKKNSITSVTIPSSVTRIGMRAFCGCRNLTSINIPSGVTEIGELAFAECGKLRSIAIPSGVARIAAQSFLDCTSLTNVTISSGVKEIDGGAFWGCTSLTSVDIPSSVTKIDNEAFHGCSSLTSVNIPYGITEISDSVFCGCESLTNAAIPSSVTEIGDGAFSGCSSLTSVNIPSGVTEIGRGAFGGCSSLTSIVIPYGVTEIYFGTFYGCSGLTSINIPSSVTSIGDQAFSACSSVTSVNFPASVTKCENSVFFDCGSLTDVYYGGTQEQWAKFNFHDENGRMNPLTRVSIHYNSTMPAQSEQPTPTTTGFSDVSATAYYAEAVKWAVDKGITNGTGANTFSPDTTCNTAQILTFLWRASGSPKANASNSFTDVAGNAYYYDAAQWAKAQGMVSGSTLSPDAPCTRASTVMFIWQAAGRPLAGSAATFTDVPANADYAAAVAWAVENGVTTGTGTDTFSPDATCTRGQIVTFLYRAAAVK